MNTSTRTFRLSTIAVSASLVIALPALGAAVIFSTDFTGASQPGGVGTEIFMGGTVASGVTVSTLTPGLTDAVKVFRLDSQSVSPAFASFAVGTNGFGENGSETDLAYAVAEGEYFQFTLESTTPLELTTFNFTMAQHGFNATAGIVLRSSLDNYSANLAVAEHTGPQTLFPASVDLSEITGFDNVSEVTFRFYLYDTYVGQQNRRLGVDNIEISVIPEPRLAALAMGLLAAGFLIWRRRRS